MFETTNQYIIYSPHDKRTQRLRPRNSETCTVRGAVREKRFQGLRRCSRLSRRLERSGRRSPNPAGAGFGKRGKANFNRGKGGFHEGKLGDITGIQWDIMSCAIYIYTYPTNTNNMIFAYVWKIGHWPPSCGSNWKKWLRVKVLSFWDLVLISFTTSCSFEAHC